MSELFDNHAWLNQVEEEIIDPAREIVDPHHHLWDQDNLTYTLEMLHADTGAGHNVTKTVFIECGASYRPDGPDHLKPVGETEFVALCAARSEDLADQATIAAIVAHADLRHDLLDETIEGHQIAGNELFRGIRHSGAWDENPETMLIPPPAPKELFADSNFRRGMARLADYELTYDSWHYHHQNLEFRDLAAAVPQTTMILDHFGTPLGVGAYAGKQDEIFETWIQDIAAIAECPNVYAKLGGLAMPDNGFGWFGRDVPPTSDEFVAAQERYYHHTIDCFGPERCMFESNFPVDRVSIGYRILWNSLKKIASRYSESEQDAMFRGTAEKIYRL